MEQYLLDLIKENNRVIIPNFGAFIIAKENGITILFNNFLSFNDGLLVDYVSHKKLVERDVAEQYVADFVDALTTALDTKGSYTMLNLGTFTKDAQGVLTFEQASNIESSEAKPTVKSSAKPVSKPELLDLLDIEPDSPTPIVVEPKAEDKPKPVVTATPKVEPPKVKTYKTESDSGNPSMVKSEDPTPYGKTSSKAVEPPKEPVKTQTTYDYSEPKRSSWKIFLILLLLLLVGGGIYYFYFYQKPEPKVEIVEPVVKRIEMPDTTAVVKIVEEPVVALKPHRIIVGSFVSRDKADALVLKMKEQGFNECTTFDFKDRIMVSLASFDKVSQAYAKQEEVVTQYRIESWILTKRD